MAQQPERSPCQGAGRLQDVPRVERGKEGRGLQEAVAADWTGQPSIPQE